MEHATVDFPVELEAFGIAMEDGIGRRFVTARFVVAMVNVQTSLQLFQGAVNGDDVVVVTGVEPKRVNLFHFNAEILIVEFAIFGEELKHARQNAARESKVLLFGEGDTTEIRRDDHTFAVTQRNGCSFIAINLARDAKHQQVIGVQVQRKVGLAIGGKGVQFDDIVVNDLAE